MHFNRHAWCHLIHQARCHVQIQEGTEWSNHNATASCSNPTLPWLMTIPYSWLAG